MVWNAKRCKQENAPGSTGGVPPPFDGMTAAASGRPGRRCFFCFSAAERQAVSWWGERLPCAGDAGTGKACRAPLFVRSVPTAEQPEAHRHFRRRRHQPAAVRCPKKNRPEGRFLLRKRQASGLTGASWRSRTRLFPLRGPHRRGCLPGRPGWRGPVRPASPPYCWP